MIVGPPHYKEAAEVWEWSITFADVVPTGATIASAVFTAVKESDSSDATTALTYAARDIIGTTVSQRVKAGTNGAAYMLQMLATDSDGRAHGAERRLIIKDRLPVIVP